MPRGPCAAQGGDDDEYDEGDLADKPGASKRSRTAAGSNGAAAEEGPEEDMEGGDEEEAEEEMQFTPGVGGGRRGARTPCTCTGSARRGGGRSPLRLALRSRACVRAHAAAARRQ